MNKFYSLFNFQHQPIQTFDNWKAATDRANELLKEFPDEGFYVVELLVVHAVGKIGMKVEL